MLLIFEIQMINPQADCYAKTHIEFYAFVGIVKSRLIYKEIQVFDPKIGIIEGYIDQSNSTSFFQLNSKFYVNGIVPQLNCILFMLNIRPTYNNRKHELAMTYRSRKNQVVQLKYTNYSN